MKPTFVGPARLTRVWDLLDGGQIEGVESRCEVVKGGGGGSGVHESCGLALGRDDGSSPMVVRVQGQDDPADFGKTLSDQRGKLGGGGQVVAPVVEGARGD